MAIAVFRLGVRPSFLIKNSIIASVIVLKPLDKPANKQIKDPATGEITTKENTKKTILNKFVIKLMIIEGKGAALIQNP